MSGLMSKLPASAFAAVLAVSAAAPAFASAFWPGEVIGIAHNDVLNIRLWPSSASQIIDGYNNGQRISMTGRCKNVVTNVSFRVDAGGSANWKYSKMKAANVWCQVMTDDAQLGWARGKYIWPE